MKSAAEISVYQLGAAISPAVCHEYIRVADRAGWQPSNIRDLNPLFSRAQASIPIDLQALFTAIQPIAPAQLGGTLEIVSLIAQRTICMRYSEGEYFGIHTDAPFMAPDGARTGLSLVLYLNDDYKGGETVFPDLALEVRPATGKIVLFAPTLRHLSQPITRGAKYIIRSEVLYRPLPAQA
jgi:hypothetical protein